MYPQQPTGPGWGPQGYPPHGYAPPPPPPKKTSSALLAVLGIAGICVACMVVGALGKRSNGSADGGASSTSAPASREYVTESCSEVSHQFGVRARLTDLQQQELWRSYDGKWVRWTVTVGDIRESLGRLQMQFRCGTESLVFDGHAYFSDDQRSRLVAVQPGSAVAIEGRLSDHGRFLGLSIQDTTLTSQ